MVSPFSPFFKQTSLPGLNCSQLLFHGGSSNIEKAAAVILHYCTSKGFQAPENVEGALKDRKYIVLSEQGINFQETSPRKRKRASDFELTEHQRVAVEHKEGAMIVRAGPGSGKTRVLTERIKWLQRNEVGSEEILAISFTRAAAKEVEDRLKKGGIESSVKTFHALCKAILTEYGKGFDGVPENIKVCGGQKFSKRLEEHFEICKKRAEMKDAKFKDTKSKIAKARLEGKEGLEKLDPLARGAYEGYREEMKRRGELDFTDLLVLARDLLKADEKVRMKCQKRWKYLLVDEFQDTNKIQLELVELLGGHGNVFVVGDPDQSIYGFQGAVPDVFHSFSEKFECKEVFLKENFRCSGAILKAAKGLLDPSEDQQVAMRGEGNPVTALSFSDSEEEAGSVIRLVKDHLEKGTLGSKIAILFRTNAQAVAFKEAAQSAKLAYKAKDVIDGEEVCEDSKPNPKPDRFSIELKQQEFMTKKFRIALESAYKEMRNTNTLVGPRKQQTLLEFCRDIGRHINSPPFKGFTKAVKKSKAERLTRFAKDYSGGVRRPAGAVHEPIEIMTIHASKGKEFDVVFLTGLENGVLPLFNQKEDEERRLCYVGATRAEKKLYITHTGSRPSRKGALSKSQYLDRMGC